MFKTFIQLELLWFKVRFECMNDDLKKEFLDESYGLTIASARTINIINQRLGGSYLDADKQYYPIKFTEVTIVLPLRKHVLHKSYVYLPFEDIIFFFLTQLNNILQKGLEVSCFFLI